MTAHDIRTLLFSVDYHLLEGEDLGDVIDRLTHGLAMATGVADARHLDRPPPSQLVIPDECWDTSGEEGDTRLLSVIDLNGYPFHAEAWPVREGDPQEIDGLYPEDLDTLSRIAEPGRPFTTVPIRGRECVVIVFPFG